MNHFHTETLDLRPLDMRIFIPGISEIQVFCWVTDSRWKKISGELLATNYELQDKKYIYTTILPFLPVTPHVKLSLCFLDFLSVPRHTQAEQQVHAVAEALALLPSSSISGTCAYQCWVPCGVFSPILQGTGEKELHAKESGHLSCK